MKRPPPSIFNDVIGPVMRGPSSSHCAAALRLGRIARELMNGELQEVGVVFDKHGSLATTHKSQGSDMGLCAGLLGWEVTDERMPEADKAIGRAGINFHTKVESTGAEHPNTYMLELANTRERHTLTAISTGGGSLEITEIDGASIIMAGDYYETLIRLKAGGKQACTMLRERIAACEILNCKGRDFDIVQVKARKFLSGETLSELKARFTVRRISKIHPVLPVPSRKDMAVPFTTVDEMLAYNRERKCQLWELAVHYEAARGGITYEEVFERMKNIVAILQGSVERGIDGTQYADRILGHQSGDCAKGMKEGSLLETGILNQVVLSVTALMEMKSAMGLIVAAPTAGSCGALPGSCIGAGRALGIDKEGMTRAMLAGGMIGVFIAREATFAAEQAGCQAECGSASGMAAAALACLGGGSVTQTLSASSIALQNVLGMVCDPVGGRTEVPCLGKNVMAAANALTAANMALAGFDEVVPLSEVIGAMDAVGRSIPRELRCTGLGGLSTTKTSREIEKRLRERLC